MLEPARQRPAFQELGKNRLDELTLATPDIVRQSLPKRTVTKLYRIEEPANGSQPPPAGGLACNMLKRAKE